MSDREPVSERICGDRADIAGLQGSRVRSEQTRIAQCAPLTRVREHTCLEPPGLSSFANCSCCPGPVCSRIFENRLETSDSYYVQRTYASRPRELVKLVRLAWCQHDLPEDESRSKLQLRISASRNCARLTEVLQRIHGLCVRSTAGPGPCTTSVHTGGSLA